VFPITSDSSEHQSESPVMPHCPAARPMGSVAPVNLRPTGVRTAITASGRALPAPIQYTNDRRRNCQRSVGPNAVDRQTAHARVSSAAADHLTLNLFGANCVSSPRSRGRGCTGRWRYCCCRDDDDGGRMRVVVAAHRSGTRQFGAITSINYVAD